MSYTIKFPIEHFDEIWANAEFSVAVSELASRVGINNGQPALFNDDEWRQVLSKSDKLEGEEFYKTISTLTAWGFNKTIYRSSKPFLNALAVSDYDEIDDEIERLFRFPGCVYFEGEWNWFPYLGVQGWWMTVVNHGDGAGCIRVVLNTLEGLCPYDVPIDRRGLYDCLADSVPFVNDYLDGSSSATGEEMMQPMLIYSGLVNAARIALYLLSDNAEVEKQHASNTYRLNESGEIDVPGEISVLEVGKAAGERVEQAESEGVVKPAHWCIESDGSVNWLCGHQSHSENLLEVAEFGEFTDEELVQINKGRHEVDFTTPLPEDFPIDTKLDSTVYKKARAEGIEKVHQARARVAGAEGRSYDKTVQEGEPLVNPGESQPAPVVPPLKSKFGSKIH